MEYGYYPLCYVSNNNDSANKAQKHANSGADENDASAFCYCVSIFLVKVFACKNV